jgi:hypothetical protein
MSTWPHIPEDVIDWCRSIFRSANWRLTETILNVPPIRETTLDDTLIQALLPHSAPTLFGSGAVVRMDVHNIGGLRRMMSWEVGDIAILIFLVRRNQILGRKVGVLQAKRLYPSVGDVEENDPVGFRYGMNALLRPEESPTSMLLNRTFTFDDNSTYGALRALSNQQTTIDDFEKRFGEKSVYYLMYNPPHLPVSIRYPLESYININEEPELGTRVLSKKIVHEILAALAEGRSPTIRQIKARELSGGWKLEEWVADLLLTCREGRPYESPDETQVRQMLERRSGPIGAAIAIHVELP